MAIIPLPENCSFGQIGEQVDAIHDLISVGGDQAIAVLEEFHPRSGDIEWSSATIAGLTRTDAESVVAGLYGFEDWASFRQHLDLVEQLTRPDTADIEPSLEPDFFAARGCVSYATRNPMRRLDEASQMLAERPALATASIAAMATAGDHESLSEKIASAPVLADEPCGPNRWPPLLYCAYSRVRTNDARLSTLDAARLLLDNGADPNSGFLWRGLVPPFTALTGAFGGGESDQPAHRDRLAFARLLLEAGADPNDGQTMYNNGLGGSASDDTSHLQLLIEFGLGQDHAGPWYRRLGATLTSPAELLLDELEVAAARGLPSRMRFLVDLGLDLNRPVGRSAMTPLAIARQHGHVEVIDILIDAGAPDQP